MTTESEVMDWHQLRSLKFSRKPTPTMLREGGELIRTRIPKILGRWAGQLPPDEVLIRYDADYCVAYCHHHLKWLEDVSPTIRGEILLKLSLLLEGN